MVDDRHLVHCSALKWNSPLFLCLLSFGLFQQLGWVARFVEELPISGSNVGETLPRVTADY